MSMDLALCQWVLLLRRPLTAVACARVDNKVPTCVTGADGEPLRLCYLRHAYGMGEHYNSITAAPAVAWDGE